MPVRTGWKMTDFPNSFPDKFVVWVNMNRVLQLKGVVIINNAGFYDESISFMVGKFAGWLIYLPVLLNWVSTSQNSMCGSNMISVTLQDHIFSVAWFLIWMKCPSCSMWTIPYPGLHFKSHLPGCLFLKYT